MIHNFQGPRNPKQVTHVRKKKTERGKILQKNKGQTRLGHRKFELNAGNEGRSRAAFHCRLWLEGCNWYCLGGRGDDRAKELTGLA